MNYLRLLQIRRNADAGTGGAAPSGQESATEQGQDGAEGENGAPEGQEAGKPYAPLTATRYQSRKGTKWCRG